MLNPLIKQLGEQQTRVLNICNQAKDNFRVQYHPDLSPIGWHVGHCIYTENYWVRERLLQLEPSDEITKSLYIPEQSEKTNRGASLPEYEDLFHWAGINQTKNISLLEKHHDQSAPLMQNDFLIHFLIQHYAQHYETLQMTYAQAALQKYNVNSVDYSLTSTPLDRSYNTLVHSNYKIGATGEILPYDNEHPCHICEIKNTNFAKHPVNNSEYLRFIEENGYEEKKYWSDKGWQWRIENSVTSPEYWRSDSSGHWHGVGIQGPYKLLEREPVFGISHYEASAFTLWADARLPYEHEWEAAESETLLNATGKVWEWCHNTFYPYEGFEAYPYDGYSTPYFDGMHYTLKGGSFHTPPVIKRSSFRNYYQADKRFLFAGMRLVFE